MFLETLGAALAVSTFPVSAATPFRLGLTPVFLDNDAEVISRLRRALSLLIGTDVALEQRRTTKRSQGYCSKALST